MFAARSSQRLVTMSDMEKAKDKIMMGAERTSMVMNDKEKELTAYHEAGHAIVGRIVPGHDPVYKVQYHPTWSCFGCDNVLTRRKINTVIVSNNLKVRFRLYMVVVLLKK